MSEMHQGFGGSATPEIQRAMESVEAALRLRIDRGEATDVSRVTAMLDGAARAVEEL